MRKVLFVCPTGTLRSGGEKSNYMLIRYLAKMGYEVQVITAWRGDYAEELKQNGIKAHTLWYAWWDPESTARADRNTRATEKIARIIKSFDPDCVVTNTLNAPWGALAAAMMNKPHIWIAREFALGNFAYLRDRMDFVHAYSNQVMANSEELAKYIVSDYGIPAKHFYSFVDASNLKLGSSDEEVRIVSPNQIIDRKNQAELIKALAILYKRDKTFNVRVRFIGGQDEPYTARIKRLAQRSGVDHLIEYLGFRNDPWSFVGESDILVQTSLSESIGRTTTEAMKLGVPIIASDIPGHREAFSLGGGVLYKSGDSSDLAKKIQQVAGNITKAKADAANVRKKALKTMSEHACNQPFVEVLERVIGHDNPRKELRHLYESLFVSMNEEIKERDRIISWQANYIERTDARLNKIQNSPYYKVAKTFHGLFHRERSIAAVTHKTRTRS